MSRGNKAFALKFISGKYQGGEFPLQPGLEVQVGRSADLDMVLVEDMVSRKHARIVASEAGVTIQDLGSTNGTFVNGQRIDEIELHEGDRILIGTSILKLVLLEGDARLLETRGITHPAEKTPGHGRAGVMGGRIDEVTIPDLLQLFSASHKTGVLLVTSDGKEGRIYLRQGQIYYAAIDESHDLGPEKSFHRIVMWETGTFELGPPEIFDFPTLLEDSTEALLMESARMIDEIRRLPLPSPESKLQLATPLGAPLRELSGEQLDLLQMVLEGESIGNILDKLPATDLDTARGLIDLMDRNYVRLPG